MINHFPNDWGIHSFKEIAEVVTGTTPSTNHAEYYGGSLPFVGPAELGKTKAIIQSSKYLSSAGAKQARILPAETILVCCIGATIGKVGFSGVELATNQQINSLICNQKIAFPKYVFHYCKTLKSIIQHQGASTTLPLLPKGRFQELKISLPPITEQKRIAAILDKAEEIRSQRRQALEQLDTIAQSIFLEMFGDVGATSRFPVYPLKSILSQPLQNGAYFPKDFYVEDDGIEMVHMSDAFYNVVVRGKLKKVRCNDDDIKKYSLSNKDILIARRSLTYEGAAKPCLIPLSPEPLIFESSFIRLTPDPEKVDVAFLFNYLNNEWVKRKCIQPYITQSTISGINQSNLERVPVLVPPITLQQEFARRVEAIAQLKATHRESLAQLDALFASLQHRAFRGEL